MPNRIEDIITVEELIRALRRYKPYDLIQVYDRDETRVICSVQTDDEGVHIVTRNPIDAY